MKRPVLTTGTLIALGTIPLAVVLLVLPGDRSRALDVYLLYLGAVLMLVLARMTSGADRRRKPLPPKADPPPPQLPELARVEREVVLATGSGFDSQMRIGPLVRDIARHRLWTRRGINLDEQPERAQEVLGDDLWKLLRPGRPDPNARYSKGRTVAELRQLVDRIEKV